MRPSPRDEFGHDQARLDRLAQPDTIREQEAGTAHAQGAHDGNELIGRDVEATGLHRQERGGAESLFQEKGIMVEPPLAQPSRAAGVEVGRDRMDRLERVKQVDFQPLQITLHAAQPESILLTGGLGMNDLPRQPAGFDLRSREQGAHLPLRTTTDAQGSCGSGRLVMIGPSRHADTSREGP